MIAASDQSWSAASLTDQRILRARLAADALAKLVVLVSDEVLVAALSRWKDDHRPVPIIAMSLRGWYKESARGFYHMIHMDLIALRDRGILDQLLPRLSPEDADAIVGALEDSDALAMLGKYRW